MRSKLQGNCHRAVNNGHKTRRQSEVALQDKVKFSDNLGVNPTGLHLIEISNNVSLQQKRQQSIIMQSMEHTSHTLNKPIGNTSKTYFQDNDLVIFHVSQDFCT